MPRVGAGHPVPIRPVRRDPTREKPWHEVINLVTDYKRTVLTFTSKMVVNYTCHVRLYVHHANHMYRSGINLSTNI